RARFGAVLSYLLGFAMVGSALWYAHSRLQVHEASVQPGRPPVSSLIAWSLRMADRSYTAVIAIPPGRPAVAVAGPGATVVELPTTPADGGGLQVDTRGLKSLRLLRFPDIGGRLVRVVVLNGNGRPGIGAQLSTRLAPVGYRVVASQNLSTFDTEESQVIA